MARDNFTKKIITLLAERVGFLCSNPLCQAHTVGPNNLADKSTRIGKAAHITAASIGGPRYDNSLTSVERTNINNGIWLCSNCSDLIDKDYVSYPTILLKSWKVLAEYNMSRKIKSNASILNTNPMRGPYLEADLVYNRSARLPRGYSDKNPGEFENGKYVINISNKPIIHWELSWQLSLLIYNNSSVSALNVKVQIKSDIKTLTLSTLPKVNNIKAFEKTTLKITYGQTIEDSHIEADRLLAKRIPSGLDGTTIEIIYLDESRNEYTTVVKIDDQQIINEQI